MDAWPHESQNARYMSADLAKGRELGQCVLYDLRATTDFIMSASAGGIRAMRDDVDDPHAYMDSALGLLSR